VSSLPPVPCNLTPGLYIPLPFDDPTNDWILLVIMDVAVLRVLPLQFCSYAANGAASLDFYDEMASFGS
ncbi:Os01g0386700, partial [Oryza sativa Japonica Group]